MGKTHYAKYGQHYKSHVSLNISTKLRIYYVGLDMYTHEYGNDKNER
jgi:hypothetical protein